MEVGSLVVALACQVLAVLAVPRVPPLALAVGPGFWVFFLLYLRASRSVGRSSWIYALLFPLYAITFSVRPDALMREDWILNTDTWFHLGNAAQWFGGPRHPGLPVITFPARVLEDLVSAFGGSVGAGLAAMVVQGALAGVLTVALLDTLLREAGVSRRLAAGMAGLYGVSLAPWTFAAVGDTYVHSVFVSAAFLVVVARLARGTGNLSVASAGLLGAIALGISLENVYLLFAYAVAICLSVTRATAMRGLRSGLLVVLMASSVPALLIASEAVRFGPAYWHTWGDHRFDRPAENLVEHLRNFRGIYREESGLPSASTLRDVAFRFAVPAVRAQSNMPPPEYGIRIHYETMRWPGNAAYLGGLSMLLLAGTWGASRAVASRDGPSLRVLALLGVVWLVRLLSVAAAIPRQSVLFSAPSVFAMWALVGIGVQAFLAGRGGLARAAVAVLVAAMGALLFASNLRYLDLVGKPESWSRSVVPSSGPTQPIPEPPAPPP